MTADLRVPGVYAIEHAGTKRAYVGQALNILDRWTRHRRALRNGRHDNKPLQRAWTKYGEDAFTIRVLVNLSHLSGAELESVLAGYEVSEMAKRRNLYNRAKGGFGRSPVSEETRARLSVERKKMWADPAFREKRAAALALAMANPDMQRRRGAAISATRGTEEAKAMQSERTKGYWSDPEFRAKRAASLNATWADPERRARHGEALKAAWARRREPKP